MGFSEVVEYGVVKRGYFDVRKNERKRFSVYSYEDV